MIFYLGYYACEEVASEQRIASPPAMNKMKYLSVAMASIGDERVTIVSPSETSLHKIVKGSTHSVDDNVTLKTFFSFRSACGPMCFLGHIITKISLILYLCRNVKRNDHLVVYHSLALQRITKFIKMMKKCDLIIEAEELYADVKENARLRRREMKYMQIADKYIAITEMLNDEINPKRKPAVICHGTYHPTSACSEKFSDGKIHVVYAGTFNPIKGGVYSAIDSAEFLDDKYVLHILGKGNDSNTEIVKKRIEEMAHKSKCKIIFGGYKTGSEFDCFIQSCHIGLSTQQPNGKYNASSFPSKILMYMSNGLNVVSVYTTAIAKSNVSENIVYYYQQKPYEIAKAIMSVNISAPTDSRSKLLELDNKFKRELKTVLGL